MCLIYNLSYKHMDIIPDNTATEKQAITLGDSPFNIRKPMYT